MARLSVQWYLANGDVHPDYEIDAELLIRKFIGDDTGAPLTDAAFTLETDDGYVVTISVDARDRRRSWERAAAFRGQGPELRTK
ncbi:MAG: hypothetical protein ABSH03_18135 [Candidatus Lustribacter sp.]|jgi:hypothetical protein